MQRIMLNRITSSKLWCDCGSLITKVTRNSSSLSTNQKSLKVAIIGAPNAGKSTLVNTIVGERVSAVTHIAHTTRSFANGILTIGDTQLIFTDTPGVVSYSEGRRLKMHSNHIRTPNRIAGSVDLLAVITDVSNRKTKNYIDENILEIMSKNSEVPAVLIMNKVDRLKRKEGLLLLTSLLMDERKRDEWGYKSFGGSKRFKECFFTCALTGEGVDPMLEYFVRHAKGLPWEYSSEDIYCDSSVEAQIAEVFREKLLVMFGKEIPWQVKQETVLFSVGPDSARIHQKLSWPRKSQGRYVATKQEELMEKSLQELQNMFKCPINLSIDISHKKNMSTDDLLYF